jgi:single-strand DNA-binding protein
MSNIVILEGHIGADIELRHTNTAGKAVANFRMATNRKYTNSQNQLVEDTQWHNIVCWDKTAVNVTTFMRKGSHVLVEGRLQTREFGGQTQYAANGQVVVDAAGQPIQVKRYATEIVATRVKFLDKKPQAATYPVAAATAGVAAAAPAAAAPAAVFVQPAPAVAAPVVGAPVVAADPNVVAGTFVPPVVVGPGV